MENGITSRTYFMGFVKDELHSNDYEKDCSLDNYGLFDDDENEFICEI